MANATVPGLYSEAMQNGPFIFDLPVAATTSIMRGVLVSQLTASGAAVPYSTSSSGPVVGVAQHDIANSGSAGDKRIRVETKRLYAFTNGTSTDAFSEASLIGAVVYGSDDHTVADNSDTNARTAVGFFMGMESDGKVRVFIDPILARLVHTLKSLTDSPASADALRDNIVNSLG